MGGAVEKGVVGLTGLLTSFFIYLLSSIGFMIMLSP